MSVTTKGSRSWPSAVYLVQTPTAPRTGHPSAPERGQSRNTKLGRPRGRWLPVRAPRVSDQEAFSVSRNVGTDSSHIIHERAARRYCCCRTTWPHWGRGHMSAPAPAHGGRIAHTRRRPVSPPAPHLVSRVWSPPQLNHTCTLCTR